MLATLAILMCSQCVNIFGQPVPANPDGSCPAGSTCADPPTPPPVGPTFTPTPTKPPVIATATPTPGGCPPCPCLTPTATPTFTPTPPAGSTPTPTATPSGACYARSGYLSGSNVCGTSQAGNYYDTHPSDSAFAMIGDHDYLVATMANDLGVYDVGNPLNPILLSSSHIPWDWNSIGGEGTHGSYNNHLYDVAMVDGFQYALVELGTYGWDLFKLAGSQSVFLHHGYHPTNVTSTPTFSAALFTISGNTYAVAQKLDSQSISGNDNAVRIYHIGNGSAAFTEGLTPANIGRGTVIPLLSPFPTGTTGFWTRTLVTPDGRTLAVIRGASLMTAYVSVVDVSNPAIPLVLSTTQVAQLKVNGIALNPQHFLLFAGDQRIARVYSWQINPTTGSVTQGPNVDWIAGAPVINGASVPSSVGDLLVVVGNARWGYVSLAHGTPAVLPDGGPDFSEPNRLCGRNPYQEGGTSGTVFEVGGTLAVCRSLAWDQDIVAVNCF